MKADTLQINANGNGAGIIVREAEEPLERADERGDTERSGYNRLTPTVVHLRTSAHEDGYGVARKSGDLRPVPETVERLTEKWRKVAQESDQGAYDPSANLHDKHYQEEFERKRDSRQDSEDAIHHAEINLREKEDILAQTPEPQQEGSATFWFLFVVAIAVLSTGFAPTFHDVFFIGLAMADPVIAWLSSALVSIPVGMIVAMLILFEFGRTIVSFNWPGLTSGIGVALGFLLMRIYAAGAIDSLSIGLTVFEIAAVLGLEAVAYYRRKARKEAHEIAIAHTKATNDVQVASEQMTRSSHAFEGIEKAIRLHIEYVESRNCGSIFNSAIENALVTAAEEGYNAGVRDNHGRRIARR